MKRLVCAVAFLLATTTAASAQYANTLNGALSVGFVSNPCVSTTRLSNVPINVSTATTTQLIGASTGARIYVCKVLVIEAGTTNVTLETGTGASCGTNTTALTGPMPLSWYEPSGTTPDYVSATGYALCLVNSAAIQVSGSILYVIQQ
jgi:hypothetical protein